MLEYRSERNATTTMQGTGSTWNIYTQKLSHSDPWVIIPYLHPPSLS